MNALSADKGAKGKKFIPGTTTLLPLSPSNPFKVATLTLKYRSIFNPIKPAVVQSVPGVSSNE